MSAAIAKSSPNEECDDGEENSRPFCLRNRCGDGFLYAERTNAENPNPLEECDDGNTNPNDGCSEECTISPEL